MHKSSHGSYGIWLVFWVVTVVCFFEIFWTSGVLTVNFRDSIPRPMGCHENMIKIDIRDVSPHHLILLVDSYFSIKVTGNVFFFFCRTSWCQFLLLCIGSGMHSMLRYYHLDKTNRWFYRASIYSCSAFFGVFRFAHPMVFVWGDQGKCGLQMA